MLSLFLSLLVPGASAAPDVCDVGGGSLEGFAAATTAADGRVIAPGAETLGRQIVVGDFDGNSTPDVAVSADMAKVNGLQSGAVYVFLDADPTDTLDPATADAVVEGPRAYDRLGFALAVGDLDLDGVDDLVASGLGQSSGTSVAYAISGVRLTTGGPIDVVTESFASFRSPSRYDGFGNNVAVGDLNNDGYADLMVGAPVDDTLAKDAGAAYAWIGPVSGDHDATMAPIQVLGDVAGARLGDEVGSLGDMDGDGYAEFGIGAYLDSTGGTDAGALYVLRGGAFHIVAPGTVSASSVDLRLFGKGGERLGRAFAGADDGSGDIWVSAVRAGSSKQGAVYRVPGTTPDGGAPVAAVQTFALNGFESGGVLGGSVAVGDVDGDGDTDLVAGATYATGTTRQSGAVIVAFGPFSGASRLATGAGIGKLGGQVYKQDLGAAVAVADLDGDGFDDVLGGAPRDPSDATNGGQVYIFRGGADGADLVTFYADDDSDGYGSNVTTQQACSDTPPAGAWLTTSGDCQDDPGLSGALFHPGAAEGCADPDYNCDGVTGAVDGDGDGFAACLGDCDDNDANVNPDADEVCGDGIDNDCANGVDDSGAVDAQTWYVDSDGDGYGWDGFPVVQCGTPDMTFVTYTKVGGDCFDSALDPDAKSVNPDGIEVCGDGLDNDCANGVDGVDAVDAPVWYADVDGDGYGDAFKQTLACSEPLGSWTRDFSDCDDLDGAVAPDATETCNGKDDDCDGLFYLGGDRDLTTGAFRALAGQADGAKLGQGNVTVVGDQDLDGDGEIVVAYPSADVGASNVGVVLVVDGQEDGGTRQLDPNGTAVTGAWSTRIRGTGTNMELGRGVATGDVNGDLVADLILGAPGARFPSFQQGGVYVFFGPLPDGDLTVAAADVVLEGASAGARAGASVSVGDVDGDGYGDIVVGSPTATVDGLGQSGMLQVVYGRASGAWPVRMDLALDADAYVKGRANDRAGDHVAVLDLDGDGADDLVFGSTRAATLSAGRMYVAYGTPVLRRTGEIAPAASYVGAQFNEQLTTWLASAGDVDADGDDDLLVSTNYNRAWLIQGDSTRLAGVDASIATAAAIRFDGALGAQAGERATGVGDVNGDGFDDMAFDAVDDDEAGRDAGAVWIVYGRADFTPVVPFGGAFVLNQVETFGRDAGGGRTVSAQNSHTLEGVKIAGSAAFDAFGASVGGGDVNGDGVSDLVAGASGADSHGLTDNGRVSVFPGGAYGADVGVTDGTEQDWFTDLDQDGFTSGTATLVGTCAMHVPQDADGTPLASTTPSLLADCDDAAGGSYPGNPADVDGDGVDNDCDGNDAPAGPTCLPGTYVDGGSCTACASGTYQPDADQASCIPASPGHFVADEGAIEETACPVGRYQWSTGSTSCYSCYSGTYADTEGSETCQNADEGHYVPTSGASEQFACPAGSYSSYTGASYCDTCYSGSYQPDEGQASCIYADAGSFVSGSGATEQTECAAGSYSSYSGADDCQTCYDGTYQPLPGQTSCLQADPGYHVPGYGETSQTICAAGTYSSYSGAWTCNDCYDGEYQPLPGQTSCLDADPGYYVSGSRSTSQTICAAGTYSSSSGAWTCNDCNDGRYQPLEGQTSCLEADPGHYASGSRSTSQTACAAGTFAASSGAWSCDQCSSGDYQPLTGQTDCLEADLGYHVPGWGSASQTVCPAGSYADATGQSYCDDCSPGSYQPSAGQASCLDADVGHYVDDWNATSQDTCPAGEVQPSTGQSYCTTCGSDAYASADGSSCIDCPTGTTAPAGSDDPGDCVVSGATPDRMLASEGMRHCVLSDDLDIVCWGNNPFGATSTGLPHPPSGAWPIAYDNGHDAVCATYDDGSVQCAGNESAGELTIPDVGPGAYTDIALGAAVTCVIDSTNVTTCHGSGPAYGEDTPPTLPVGEYFVDIEADLQSFCGVVSDGSVVCWGNDHVGQAPSTAFWPTLGSKFLQLAVGTYHACAVDDAGGLECWGDNTLGQTNVPAPPAGYSFDAVRAGNGVTCALASNDDVLCWGDAAQGRLAVPTMDPGVTLGAVSIMDDSVCAVSSEGEMVCWGGNGSTVGRPTMYAGVQVQQITMGRAGFCTRFFDGSIDCEVDDAYTVVPAPPSGAYAVDVDAGMYDACAAYSDGTLACWGEDNYGHSVVPTPPMGSKFVDVELGYQHACALTDGGGVYCWGTESDGQFAVPAAGMGSFESIEAGDWHTCGMTSDGEILCWGASGPGVEVTPTPPLGTIWISYAVGRHGACALASDDSITCWGSHATVGQPVPSPPVGEQFRDVVLDYRGACAVSTSGTLSCWGGSSYLPSGTTTETYDLLSSGPFGHGMCGMRTDGSLDCFGQVRTFVPPTY